MRICIYNFINNFIDITRFYMSQVQVDKIDYRGRYLMKYLQRSFRNPALPKFAHLCPFLKCFFQCFFSAKWNPITILFDLFLVCRSVRISLSREYFKFLTACIFSQNESDVCLFDQVDCIDNLWLKFKFFYLGLTSAELLPHWVLN